MRPCSATSRIIGVASAVGSMIRPSPSLSLQRVGFWFLVFGFWYLVIRLAAQKVWACRSVLPLMHCSTLPPTVQRSMLIARGPLLNVHRPRPIAPAPTLIAQPPPPNARSSSLTAQPPSLPPLH